MNLTFRKTLILSGALAMLAGPAMAQQGPPPNQGHGQPNGQPYGQPYGQPNGQQYGQHPPPPPPPHYAPQHEAYGPPHGGWHQGDHYYGSRDEVDWHRYNLHEPPHGYEWVQSGDQFVLIAITSGIIASIIASSAQ